MKQNKEYKVNRILELDLKNRSAIITKKEQERERERRKEVKVDRIE